MTDARIEAALNAAWSHTIQHQGGMSFAQYQDKSPDAAGEFRKAIVAAIEAADAAGWQQTETAPANEAIILCVGDFVCAGFKDELFSDPDGIGLFYRGDNLKRGPLKPQPTHWHPLPAPPYAPQEGNGNG